MLAQEVPEGFVGELLEIHHPIAPQQIECLPSLIVELDTFAGHGGETTQMGGCRFPQRAEQCRNPIATPGLTPSNGERRFYLGGLPQEMPPWPKPPPISWSRA